MSEAGILSRAAEVVGRFPSRRVLVVGDIMLDEYVFGTVGRISPEAPVPVVAVTRETKVPGGAANVAFNLRGLGAGVELAGLLGDDAGGRFVARQLPERPQRVLEHPRLGRRVDPQLELGGVIDPGIGHCEHPPRRPRRGGFEDDTSATQPS